MVIFVQKKNLNLEPSIRKFILILKDQKYIKVSTGSPPVTQIFGLQKVRVIGNSRQMRNFLVPL